MPIVKGSPEIPVLLLFNLDPDWSAGEFEEVLNVVSSLGKSISAFGYPVTPLPVTGDDLEGVLGSYDPLEQIVFNWCESIPGVNHSEWLVAEYLERRGFIFTGAGSAALALAQDKIRIKRLLEESGIPTPAWRTYERVSGIDWDRFPAIVKPSKEHCSEGIDRNAVVETETELKNRVAYILEKYRQPVLVEDFIDGRELHVSLWENGSVDMLPPAEMEFSLFNDERDRICSYEAKFVPESEQYQKIQTVLPAPLSERELYDVERVCKAAYTAAGCRDYARIDLRMRDGKPHIIDVNPNADISPDTSTIAAIEFVGFTYGEFGGHLVGLAARRHPLWAEHIFTGDLDVLSPKATR